MHNRDQPKATTYTGAGISPVPEPGKDAEPPEPYRGIYLMPMFMCLYSHDLKNQRFSGRRDWVSSIYTPCQA